MPKITLSLSRGFCRNIFYDAICGQPLKLGTFSFSRKTSELNMMSRFAILPGKPKWWCKLPAGPTASRSIEDISKHRTENAKNAPQEHPNTRGQAGRQPHQKQCEIPAMEKRGAY
jgi:hypothetical protein